MLESTKDLIGIVGIALGLFFLPYLMFAFGYPRTVVAVYGIVLIGNIITFFKSKKKENRILNEAFSILSRDKSKVLYVDQIGSKCNIEYKHVLTALEIFKRKGRIPYDIELIYLNPVAEERYSDTKEKQEVQQVQESDIGASVKSFEERHKLG